MDTWSPLAECLRHFPDSLLSSAIAEATPRSAQTISAAGAQAARVPQRTASCEYHHTAAASVQAAVRGRQTRNLLEQREAARTVGPPAHTGPEQQ